MRNDATLFHLRYDEVRQLGSGLKKGGGTVVIMSAWSPKNQWANLKKYASGSWGPVPPPPPPHIDGVYPIKTAVIGMITSLKIREHTIDNSYMQNNKWRRHQ